VDRSADPTPAEMPYNQVELELLKEGPGNPIGSPCSMTCLVARMVELAKGCKSITWSLGGAIHDIG
jgi:hypothetical protein